MNDVINTIIPSVLICNYNIWIHLGVSDFDGDEGLEKACSRSEGEMHLQIQRNVMQVITCHIRHYHHTVHKRQRVQI